MSGKAALVHAPPHADKDDTPQPAQPRNSGKQVTGKNSLDESSSGATHPTVSTADLSSASSSARMKSMGVGSLTLASGSETTSSVMKPELGEAPNDEKQGSRGDTVTPGAVTVGGSESPTQDEQTVTTTTTGSESTAPMLEARLVEDVETGDKEMPVALAALEEERDASDAPLINFKDARVQFSFVLLCLCFVGLAVGLGVAMSSNEATSSSPAPSFAPSMMPSPSPSVAPTTSRSPTDWPTTMPSISPSSQPTTPLPTSAPSVSPTQTVAPSVSPTYTAQFPTKTHLKLPTRDDCTNCIDKSAVAFGQNGTVLAVLSGDEVLLLSRNNAANDWLRLDEIPPLQLSEGLRHKQNLDLIVHQVATSGLLVYTVALAFTNHCAVFRWDSSSSAAWVQLGPDFVEFTGEDTGSISIELATPGELVAEAASISVILAVARAEYPGASQVSLYEHHHTEPSTWALLGGERIPGFVSFTETAVSISLGDSGRIVAIGILTFSWTGRIRVYGRRDTHNCGNTLLDPNLVFWCQLGEEITSGDYEDESASSIALSSDGRRLVAGAPGSYECWGSDFCSLAQVYELVDDSLLVPKWLPVGQPLAVYGSPDDDYRKEGFGRRVDISADGNMIAITQQAWGFSDHVAFYLFVLSRNIWELDFEYTWHLDPIMEVSRWSLEIDLSPFPPYSLVSSFVGNVTVFH